MQLIQRHFLKGTLLLVAFVLIMMLNQFLGFSPEFIQQWILSWGFWAPLIFIAMFTARPFTFFPSSLLGIAGGLAFGAVGGFFYTWLGSSLGALLSFWAARTLGKSFVKKEWPGNAGKIQKQMEQRGFFYVFILRLVPFLNFDMVSYLAAVSRVRFSAYTFATLIGIIPGAFAYAFLGSSVASGEFQMIMIAAVVLIIFLLVPIRLRKTRY
jgi:uncharacterized membrane protein YdjX (TVP38/TMEM64 family)